MIKYYLEKIIPCACGPRAVYILKQTHGFCLRCGGNFQWEIWSGYMDIYSDDITQIDKHMYNFLRKIHG